jgi:hypothetical protein
MDPAVHSRQRLVLSVASGDELAIYCSSLATIERKRGIGTAHIDEAHEEDAKWRNA